jgi:hypothetical protein
MDTDTGALVAIAKAYFDAAYEMDADKVMTTETR